MAKDDSENGNLRRFGFNPNLISLEPAIDVSGWSRKRLDEYAEMMESNRKEAEECYNLACSQSNSMTAVTAVALSIIVSGFLMSDSFRNLVVFFSLCCIALAFALSGYASMKSRRIVATHPNGYPSLVSAADSREMKVASINLTLKIENDHRKETDRKRRYLD